MIKRYLIALVLGWIALPLAAQTWDVPADQAARLSPFAFSDSTRKAGMEIYMTNCKSCHGDPGKNNVIQNLVPPPPDPASAKIQVNSDGALHFKISQGKIPMPAFKNILSATDVWKVISFIRSFNDQYVQKTEVKAVAAAVQNVKINLAWNKDQHQVQTSITGTKDKINGPVANAEVKLFVKRYFGNLQVDEPRNTDAQGKVLFTFPTDLPGDSIGRVHLIVKLSDEATFGEVKVDSTLTIGVPTYRPPLNAQRAMWNTVRKAPIWILLSYTLGVLIAWGFIIYVFLQIRAIFKSGSKE